MPSSTSGEPDLRLFLARLTSRSILTAAEQQAILSLPSKSTQMLANRDFIKVGEQVDYACFIADGLVGRFGQNRDGERQITAIHLPGDMPDLYSVVQPRCASPLQALSIATILCVPHHAIREAAARFPAIGEALWRDCVVDAAILAQWVVNVGRRDAKARLAHLICEIACRLGLVGKGNTLQFPFAVTQSQLADATGLTCVHVNRTIKVLREARLVDIRERTVQVLDWKGLVRTADFDCAYLQMGCPPEERLRITVAG